MLPSAFCKDRTHMPVCFVALAATCFTSPPAESRRERKIEEERMRKKTTWEIRLEIFAAARVVAEWRCA